MLKTLAFVTGYVIIISLGVYIGLMGYHFTKQELKKREREKPWQSLN